jgi:hypothetical protein
LLACYGFALIGRLALPPSSFLALAYPSLSFLSQLNISWIDLLRPKSRDMRMHVDLQPFSIPSFLRKNI